MQPACEYFPPLDDPVTDPVFPLRLWLCAACGLAQLADDAEIPDEPEGLEPAALARQRADAVATAHAAGLLPVGATVAEGATPHGGSWQAELESLGLRFVADDTVADVVVDGTFGMMHATDQAAALDRLVDRLAPDGVLLFQFHSLAAILREEQWNAVRLGHYAYYSLPALLGMLEVRGLGVTSAWSFPLYGGTVMIAARRGAVADTSVARIVDDELASGVLDARALQKLQEGVDTSTAALRQLAEDASGAGQRVYAYSAASRAVALLYLADLHDDLLLGVADAAPAKHGCRMPGTTVPIISPSDLIAAGPDVVLMFVTDLLPEVRRALPEIEACGGRWMDAGSGAVATATT
ncbi:transferase [Pseudonocardia sp.]|uniref:transferase n=1 Tax=Pseudonocardia sp. TaxID=60912 RepID=UPI002623BF82|nr:transferase [Pseudonocardia sp.]